MHHNNTQISPENTTSNPFGARRIMIIAGEASGDLHGSNLVMAMHRRDPTLRFYGIGGNRLKKAGVELVAHSSEMAVVGLTEVITKLRMILKVMGRLKASLKEMKPDMVILIDYPDFNLPLAKAAHKQGIKVLYYISPQVWAWRKGRIKKIKKFVDKMAVILPFEAQMYHEADVDVVFVGHPLLDVVKKKYPYQEAMERFGLQDGLTTVSLLPGSRSSEVVKLLPEMLQAAEILSKMIPTIQFVLPLADTLDVKFVQNIMQRYAVEVHIIQNDTYDVISISDIAMVASGTATLETALLGIPMIIVYKISRLSYSIGKQIIKVDHIGLANIIAGKTIVPELIQDKANPRQIACEIYDILSSRTKMEEMKFNLSTIREKLGKPGVAERVARLAFDMLS
jgi:lipid-A-disaccharide synthase